ncbi:MAG: hypothetical protein WAO71_08455 [Gallionella sp.]
MTCRPVGIFASMGFSKPVHCATFVWHWESSACDVRQKKIDAQYSLSWGRNKPLPQWSSHDTYYDDRKAFNGSGDNYLINPPSGMSQQQFDQATIRAGSTYSQGAYSLPGFGPNSNTSANDIITNAGGVPPDISGAAGQHYSLPPPSVGGDGVIVGP